jgi:hypothetical protein
MVLLVLTRLIPAMRKPIFPGTRFLWMDLLLMIAVVALAVVGVLIFWYDERRMKQRYYEQKVRESLEEE